MEKTERPIFQQVLNQLVVIRFLNTDQISILFDYITAEKGKLDLQLLINLFSLRSNINLKRDNKIIDKLLKSPPIYEAVHLFVHIF